MKEKYTIRKLNKDFGTDKKILEYLFNKKYKKSMICPSCNKHAKFYLILKHRKYVSTCGHSVFPTKNTIFYNSALPLSTWFQAIFMFSISKNGVSAKELERMLGVPYKTAWRMANKIRTMMANEPEFISGIVEVDEAYFGGKEPNKHKHKRSKSGFVDKAKMLGMKARSGKIIVKKIINTTKKTLFKGLYDHIAMNSTIISDRLQAYKEIQDEGYWSHLTINHSKREYARTATIDDAHLTISINGIENFWSIFKRSAKGTYIRITKKWLQLYINEFVFRLNNKDKSIFAELIKRIFV